MIVREKRRERRSDGRRAHDDLRDASNLCGLVISELAESGEPTSGLEPLTCSLRVITHALQGVARGCKCRIPKPVSFLRLAPTEIRPGNYVFYDAMQVGLAIVPLDHCALRVLATVVSVARRYL
jgi:hypothetical protein